MEEFENSTDPIMKREDLDATLIFWVFEQEKSTDYSVLGRVRRNRKD